MTSNWFFVLGIALVMGLFGLAGAGKQVQSVELWWDQRDGPETAMASALAPIIDCVNRVDRETRLTYFRLTTLERREMQPSLPAVGYPNDREEFGDTTEPQARLIQKDVCGQKITHKLESLQPGSRLIGVANRYLSSLDTITPLTMDSNSPKLSTESAAHKRLFNENMLALLKENLISKGTGYTSISAELRRSLDREEQRLRPAQLAVLETRFGKDLHWQVLNYMIAARYAVNQVDQGVRTATLTPQALAALTASVQLAGENSEAFVNRLPRKARNDDAVYLWNNVKPNADAYLEALQALLKDWLEHAPPQQLSDDYYRVTRRYDALLSYYNRQARNAF